MKLKNWIACFFVAGLAFSAFGKDVVVAHCEDMQKHDYSWDKAHMTVARRINEGAAKINGNVMSVTTALFGDYTVCMTAIVSTPNIPAAPPHPGPGPG